MSERTGWNKYTGKCRDVDPELFEKRFWNKCQKGEECWIWMGSKSNKGYGVVCYGRTSLRASRVSWELVHGPIPVKMEVCHKCDNPSCVNPDHLFLGTHAENMADCKANGRIKSLPGSQRKNSKLTDSKVREIRASSLSQNQLARLHGVSQATISNVLLGRNWFSVV